MARINLTARSIKALPIESKTTFFTDDVSQGGVEGLSIEVRSSGRKQFFWRRYQNGIQRRITIGTFPSISLAAARDKAKDLNYSLRNEGFHNESVSLTLKEFWNTNYSKRDLPKLALTTQRAYQEAFNLLEQFHDRELTDVRRAEIAEFIGKLGERSESLSNKVRAVWLVVYNKAIELDLIEAKPNFPKPFKMKPKEGFLDTDEVGRLLKVLKKYDKLYSLYFQTVLFTGARKTEVCSMTWDSLDLNRGLWIRRQKGGSKVPTAISDQLNKDLKKWKTHQFHSSVLHGTPWVFPSTKDPQERLKDPMKHWKTICALADIQNATIHTLRHTCASWMVQDGASLSVIGKQLGHRQTSTTERYAHLDITSTKAAVNSVEKKMLTSLSK